MGQRVNALLQSAGAVLVRRRKHKIWRLPNGNHFAESTSPGGNPKANDLNHARDLRRALGITSTETKQEGERREKKRKEGRPEPIKYEPFKGNTLMAEKLQVSGAEALALRRVIETLELERGWYEEEIARLRGEIEAHRCLPPCWWCRLKRWKAKQ